MTYWTPERIAAMPGWKRPPWYHPIRRWAWTYDILAADGKSLLVGVKPLHRVTKAERAARMAEHAAFLERYRREPAVHPDGVPIGLRPGDPVDPKNFKAIFDYVQRVAREDHEQHERGR